MNQGGNADRHRCDQEVLEPRQQRQLAVQERQGPEHHHHRADPDGPREKRRDAGDGEERSRDGRRPLVPDDERPPHRDGEELRDDLREIRLLHERADEMHAREEEQHDRDHRERHTRPIVGQHAACDQEDEPRLERHGSRDDREHRMQRVAPDPRAREHGQQVAARRVVDHLAEIFVERGVVREPPVALDVLEQRQVMREVGAAAGWQKVGARAPEQPRERGGDAAEERGERGGVARGQPTQPDEHRRRGAGGAHQNRQRPDGKPDRIGQVRGSDRRGEKRECGRRDSLRADERHRN